jgi:hypothetical protein
MSVFRSLSKFLGEAGIAGVIVGIVVLVRPEGAGRGSDLAGHVPPLDRARPVSRAIDEDEIDAHRAHCAHLVACGVVIDDRGESVAALESDQRKARAGVAGCWLDDEPAGLERARPLGGEDHLSRHAHLGRAGRVELLELEQEAAASTSAGELEQRRAADQVRAARDDSFGSCGTRHHR